MKTFTCQCGNTLHFTNTKCVQCGLTLGFLPDEGMISAFTTTSKQTLLASNNGREYRECKNYKEHHVCNWMVANDDPNDLCVSCRLTDVIPNLNEPENKRLWFLLEQAKRRFLYSAIKLKLPIKNRKEDPVHGLGFAFLQDEVEDQFGNELFIKHFVTTGHSDGLITLNISEAKDSQRIGMREQMNEKYRTLVGHVRHESGHYYWDLLVRNSDRLEECRELFGDERLSYQEALSDYYTNGPKPEWERTYISAYATMHPWEDWAETWAHYLHMVDTLETANDFELSISKNTVVDPHCASDEPFEVASEKKFTQLFNDWCSLTQVLNSLNRSMGMDDAYPFVISMTSLKKLRFVHQTVMQLQNGES